MFDFLRRMIVPIMMVALIGFLATIIFQWGADINSRSQFVSANTAAMINGEEVTWNDFYLVYNNMINAEMEKNDYEDIPEETRQQIQQQAWQQILNERLLLQQASLRQISVTDDELYQYMKAMPPVEIQQAQMFQTNGQFDYQKYLNSLADPNFTTVWAQFEPIMAKQIKIAKLQNEIIQTAHVTENEIKNYFMNQNEKVSIDMINVDFARHGTPAPKATEEEMREYYENNKEDFEVGKRVVMDIVLIDKQPTDEDWEKSRLEAMVVLDSIKAGADFGEMAKLYSQDNTNASKGGDLGWFPQGQMVDSFNDEVFSMKEGEVSEPVRTRFGWHLIKNHGFQDDKVHASHILFKVAPTGETLDRIYTKLENFRAAALEKGFAAAAEEYELEVKRTDPFLDNRTIPIIGADQVVRNIMFNPETEVGTITRVLDNRPAAYVCQLAEVIPPGVADFETVKPDIQNIVVNQIIQKRCSDAAAEIYADITNGTGFAEAAKKHNETVETSESLTRNSYMQGIGRAPEALGAAFALENPGDISEPIDYGKGTVIIKLNSRTSPDLTQFTSIKDSLSQTILYSKQQELYGRWYQNLVDNSDIIEEIEETMRSQRDI